MSVAYKTKISALLVILIFLIGLYVYGIFNNTMISNKITQAPLLSSFVPSHVKEIELSTTQGSLIVLQKGDSGWVVLSGKNRFPASSLKVEAFLNMIADLKRGKLISSEKADAVRFDLDVYHAKKITMRDAKGTRQWSILIGKPGQSGSEEYVQLSNDPGIFLAQSSMNFYVAQEAAYWYDLEVFPEDVTGNAIKEISVSGIIPLDGEGKTVKKENYLIMKSETGGVSRWAVPGKNIILDQASVQLLCNRLAVLQGIDLAEKSHNLSSDFTLSVTTESGAHYSIFAKAIEGGVQYSIDRVNSLYVFIVNTNALIRAVMPLENLIVRQK